MPLTKKQAAFVAARLRGASNHDAAVQAGYSGATAAVAGARLARHPKVTEALKQERYALASGAGSVPPVASAPAGPGLVLPLDVSDSKAFLLATMRNETLDLRLRMESAKALLPFMHRKLGAGGKKEDQRDEARNAGVGKFAPGKPPNVFALRREPDKDKDKDKDKS